MIMEVLSAFAVFALLCVSAAMGRYIQSRLGDGHRTRETVEAMQITIGMLVTFTALVLGLVTASEKSAYDTAGHDLQQYALKLTQLDRCLRDYGPGADAARDLIKGYTAALIASTWTSEPRPASVPYPETSAIPSIGPSPVLADQLRRLHQEIWHLKPADPFQTGVRDDCVLDYRAVIDARQAAIEDDRLPITTPFGVILVVWLVVIFATFGLIAPRNRVSLIGIALCGVSLSLAVFVIFYLSKPYFVSFSSADMRTALANMMSPSQ